jgi:hypothetical protein
MGKICFADKLECWKPPGPERNKQSFALWSQYHLAAALLPFEVLITRDAAQSRRERAGEITVTCCSNPSYRLPSSRLARWRSR